MRHSLTLVFGAMLVSVVACSSPEPEPAAPAPHRPQESRALTLPEGEKIAADLPPLPHGVAAAVREAAIVKLDYEFAARHPEVLHYIPCFCGCEDSGHMANHDCFVAKRDAKGQVAEWDTHGFHCATCIDVATMAREMHGTGASVAKIRAAVEKRFAEPGGPHTPTPMPPKSGHLGR